ncbi:MAG: hypothetical protein IJN12_03650 [Clostridia bacterium]|nr:hypothetical protein [Clostridia bacterium]
MTLTSEYIPISAYLLKLLREIENMPNIELEKLDKKCGTASLKMIKEGSRYTKWLNGDFSVRQNFEISYRTSGNDSASRTEAFAFLEQLKKILISVTDADLGEGRTFIQISPTDTPVMSVRCRGGEEEYTEVYQLVYLENS